MSQLWYGENVPSHARESLLPTGEFDLVINAKDGTLRIYPCSSANGRRTFVFIATRRHRRWRRPAGTKARIDLGGCFLDRRFAVSFDDAGSFETDEMQLIAEMVHTRDKRRV